MKLELLNKIKLDEFVAAQLHSQFLQSWDWGEFQRAVGQGVWRLGVFNEQNQLIASAQIIQHKLPLKKSYLYCPRGPVFNNNVTDEQKIKALELILSKARDIVIATSQTEEIFFRLESILNPQSLRLDSGQASILNLKQTKSIQPANTLILDLTQSIEQLLTNMHPKTRYNIKVAERHDVIIVEEKNFAAVWPLFLQTSKRDKFGIHSKNYYQKMLETIPWIKLWTAIYKNQIIAAAIVGNCGDTVTYIHGASDYDFRQLMAPYLLHWTLIQSVKNQNYKYYDFYGIAPTTNPVPSKAEGNKPQTLSRAKPRETNHKHPWSGITRFKMGFGGQVINYPGTFDFIYQNGSYQLYKACRTLNYWIRKFSSS